MRKWIVLGAATVLMTACGGEEKSYAVVRAPFIANIAGHQVSIPDTPDIQQAIFQSSKQPLDVYAKGVLCRHVAEVPLPKGCEEFRDLPIHANGITFYLRPQAGKFRYLKERPDTDAPDAAPLIHLPIFNPVFMSGGPGFNEEYEIARLQTSTSRPSLVTTVRGWPVAACDRDQTTGRSHCRLGFLIRGLIVEAYYSARRGSEVNQNDLWHVASALDRKVRSLMS